MALEEYRRKRDFKKSSEPPAAGEHTRGKVLSYLIQKHDATRLHYDLRLELGGVLLSWAVTKGPSMNPADKRLAVRVEDHPISYGSFEGTIPKGEYGGGSVMLWDTGSWEPDGDPRAGLRQGHLPFTLHGERLKGGWDLVRMKGDGQRENWLLIKLDDRYAQKGANGKLLEDFALSVTTGRSMKEIASGGASKPKHKRTEDRENKLNEMLQRYPEVQLATLVDTLPKAENWLHEIKFDGYRLLGFLSAGAVALRTRNGNDWTGRLPSLSTALKRLKVEDAVLDMEAVVVDADGKSSFQALQTALGGGGGPSQIIVYVFDLLYLNGNDLTILPLLERKENLRNILNQTKGNTELRYSSHLVGQGAELFEKACQSGLEGIISKNGNAPYLPGRQKSWQKIKCLQRQEFIILGFSDAREGDRALGALYLGYRKDGVLHYAGKAGTGFTIKSARDLAERFAKMTASLDFHGKQFA